MTHHASKPCRPRLSAGRFAALLVFAAFMTLAVMGTVLSLAGKGGQ